MLVVQVHILFMVFENLSILSFVLIVYLLNPLHVFDFGVYFLLHRLLVQESSFLKLTPTYIELLVVVVMLIFQIVLLSGISHFVILKHLLREGGTLAE